VVVDVVDDDVVDDDAGVIPVAVVLVVLRDGRVRRVAVVVMVVLEESCECRCRRR
jgi:hypothetical protein